MSVTSYAATNGLTAALVNAATLVSAAQAGSTAVVVTDALSNSLPAPPTPDGNAFESTSSTIDVQLRNQWGGIIVVAWYIMYIDLRATNPVAGDSLTFGFSDTNNASGGRRQTSFSYSLQVAPSTIPSGSYITVQGLFPVYDLVNPELAVSGTSTNALFIARVRLEQQIPAPHLLSVQPSKLLYAAGETDGSVAVNISNMTGTSQTATFIVTLTSEFDTSAVIYNTTATIPNPATTTAPVTVSIPLPAMAESGYSVSVNMQWTGSSTSVNETMSQYFYVSNYPCRFGHCGSLGVGNQIYQDQSDSAIGALAGNYIQLAEIDYWAPDDTLLQQPPIATYNTVSSSPSPYVDQWWAGQALARVSLGEILGMVAAIHSYGMKAISYTTLLYDNGGVQQKEFFRRYPQYCNWNDHSGNQNIAAVAQDQQSAMSDRGGTYPRFNINGSTNFGQEGIWSLATGDPGLVEYHAAQLQAAILVLGFDGFRYDDHYIYDYPAVSLVGNVLPFTGFSNSYVLSTLRSAIHSINPFAIYGHNTEMWQYDIPATTAMPLSNPSFTGDYYTELMYAEGMHLQERWVDSMFGRAWSLLQSNIWLIGYNAWRFGGNAYLITGIQSQDYVDGQVCLALMLASQAHIYGTIASNQLGYTQLACRYSRLIWGKNLINLFASGANPLAVASSNSLWWTNYVQSLQLSPTRTLYFTHIINQPSNPNSTASTLQAPATAVLTWTLPAGWTATAGWAITADGATTPQRISVVNQANNVTNVITDTIGINATKSSISFTQTGTTVVMTIPNIILWTIAILDITT